MIKIQIIFIDKDGRNINVNIFYQGWQKYRGGLDVRGDMTGTHSVYTTQVLIMMTSMMMMMMTMMMMIMISMTVMMTPMLTMVMMIIDIYDSCDDTFDDD